jgi:large subunit ribosomal protein L29
MNKELRQKTTEELCSLIMRLKLQLLESRFKMASGELDKTNRLPEIRKTIARALTILGERDIHLSIGTHGITMRNIKTGEVKSITNVVEEALKSGEQVKTGKKVKTVTAKDVITEATMAPAKANVTTSEPEVKVSPVVKKELKANMAKAKAVKTEIRKSVGGGS